MNIQKISLIRVMKLTDIAQTGFRANILNIKMKDASLVPICIGEKKSMFVKRDTKAMIMMLSAKSGSPPNASSMKCISAQFRTRAASSLASVM